MTELWLKYRDENGDDRRVSVEGGEFVIGRHSACDLYIPNGQLSRQHAKIEAFGEVFVVSDLGSSNGTTLNGAELREPTALRDGDLLNLGGGLDLAVELAADRPPSAAPTDSASGGSSAGAGGAQGAAVSAAGAGGSSIPTAVFIIAPALVIVLLVCGGGLLIFSGGFGGGANNRNRDITIYRPTPDETPEDSPTPSATPSSGVTPSPSPGTSAPPTPELNSEKKKIETHSAKFLQGIATNDPTAFLRSTEVDLVAAKISQLKTSAGLARNLNAVKAGAAQFQSLTQNSGIKPQFLAVAALTEIGGGAGNPLDVARTMLPVFGELRTSLANNLADDNLLMIASYDRGKAGKFNELRNSLEALAKKNPSVSPREIRTIWFLKKQGKITDTEYDFALRFIAIGTIAQNPKDFGVNAEAVVFN